MLRQLTLVGICLAVSLLGCDKSEKRIERLDTSYEAKNEIARMFSYTMRYFKVEHAGGAGAGGAAHRCPSDGRPKGSIGPTPALNVDCSQGPRGKCVPDGEGPGAYRSDEWLSNPVWRTAGFHQPRPHAFHYAFEWNNQDDGYGGACQFTIRAFGDLDGDGIFSTFVRAGGGDTNGFYADERDIVIHDEFE